MEKGLRENVMSRIFGENGITDASSTTDFESRSEDLKTIQDLKHTFHQPQTADWKPQGARELIEKIYSVTELHFLDYRNALHDDGKYRLTKANSQYRVADALWRCKSEAPRKKSCSLTS